MTGQEFGRKVQQARLERGLEPATLAAIASKSEGYIYKLERGEVGNPGYVTMSLIAVALGYKGADDLVAGPVVTPQDVQDRYDRRWGIKPQAERIEAAIDLAEQAAPPASKRRARLRQKPPAQPAEAPVAPRRKVSPGKHIHEK